MKERRHGLTDLNIITIWCSQVNQQILPFSSLFGFVSSLILHALLRVFTFSNVCNIYFSPPSLLPFTGPYRMLVKKQILLKMYPNQFAFLFRNIWSWPFSSCTLSVVSSFVTFFAHFILYIHLQIRILKLLIMFCSVFCQYLRLWSIQ